MSVLVETTIGDVVIDLSVNLAPTASLNFLKLCKAKYYNFSLFHKVERGFIAQTGKPALGLTGDVVGSEGVSFHGLSRSGDKQQQKYAVPEMSKKLTHNKKGIVSFTTQWSAPSDEGGIPSIGSQFFITLASGPLDYLDGKHAVFGEVVEGLDVLDKLNMHVCDEEGIPYKDIRIKHTIILDDPFDDPPGFDPPATSPIPSAAVLKSFRIGEAEEEDEDLLANEEDETAEKKRREKEAKSQALTLEMVGDLPFAEIKPPENVLFVCKLNPLTEDEDLQLIFSRFGTIDKCEVIRDRETGASLCYAFIEFAEKSAAEEAFFKMNGVLIDDREIRVDFSQSVSKLHRECMQGRRSTSGGGSAFGGISGMVQKTQYRSGHSQQSSRDERRTSRSSHGREKDGYGMVFREPHRHEQRRHEESRTPRDRYDHGISSKSERLYIERTRERSERQYPGEDESGTRRESERDGKDARRRDGDEYRRHDHYSQRRRQTPSPYSRSDQYRPSSSSSYSAVPRRK